MVPSYYYTRADWLSFLMNEARREHDIEHEAGNTKSALIAAGRAKGLAEALEVLGINVDAWIDDPTR